MKHEHYFPVLLGFQFSGLDLWRIFRAQLLADSQLWQFILNMNEVDFSNLNDLTKSMAWLSKVFENSQTFKHKLECVRNNRLDWRYRDHQIESNYSQRSLLHNNFAII